ncbi:XRE family transcriptional regulator [Pseudoflavonifractor sp. 524-17]|uniref:helix-turn-helix domain-containing protein n=1 Tax=Pseudoflavonifractor sp. 524-17 TaxID=2304577 RepID=UPI00137A32B0|nr:helix-turn-helix transcriptional regulator [Pseudoflavonifractor sp. 524-17]NCE63807.1 XRE family transcriptional regulator [Pseudoflavonifractor sp. 524-17]
MHSDFSRCLSLLRQEKGISQRAAAKELGISQALLSHYENGAREPGLAFVTRACDFYNVSADFLLGRTLTKDGSTIVSPEELYDYSTEKDNVLHGSIVATLNKKLLVNSVSVLFDLLGKTGCKGAIKGAADVLSTAVYTLFRQLYRADGSQNEDFFAASAVSFSSGVAQSELICAQSAYAESLEEHRKKKGSFPLMNHDALMENYPGTYQSLLQIIHNTGSRIAAYTEFRKNQK